MDDDLKHDRTGGRVITRFPPEPNGYLHIGHAKAISINFGIAAEYGGRCHLRYDDTNPETEDMEYVRAIERDLRWLGFDWGEHRYFASDYFEQLYSLAIRLIEDGKAYVDSLSEEEIREYRGTVTAPGRESPHRTRSVDENLELFQKMRRGECPDGSHVLRARIDMTSANMLMRDPVLYRIKHASHYRRGDDFPIYPLYDFAHPLSDAIENITHSLCSLEFEVHRPLYDWLVDALFDPPRPHQYEFARFNLDYTIMSKRKLLQLVDEGFVSGWDDPRMPTLAGFRKRGVTPEAIRAFAEMIGVAKAHNRVELSMLEYAIRDDLNARARRIMCVLDPLKVVITNFPEDEVEWTEAPYWPRDIAKEGTRPVPFTRDILIEREDFMEVPPKKFHRLSPGNEVRLRYGYIIRCDEIVKDEGGRIVELRCSYDAETRSGTGTSRRRVKGTIHWVSAVEGLRTEVRLYDRLFRVPNPDDIEEGKTFLDYLNPDSLRILTGAVIEPSIADAEPGDRFQFERQGYFYLDPEEVEGGNTVFNRIVTLRDSWAKISSGGSSSPEAPGVQIKSKPDTHPVDPAPRDPTVHSDPPAPRDPLAGLDHTARARALRLADEYRLPMTDAAILAADEDWCRYFESATSDGDSVAIANWIIHEMRPALKSNSPADSRVAPEQIGRLVRLISDDSISGRIAKEVFVEMLTGGREPEAIVDEKGLRQISDSDAISRLVDAVIEEFPDRVTAYRGGKTGLIRFFVGQVMRRSDGRANPALVKQVLSDKLS